MPIHRCEPVESTKKNQINICLYSNLCDKWLQYVCGHWLPFGISSVHIDCKVLLKTRWTVHTTSLFHKNWPNTWSVSVCVCVRMHVYEYVCISFKIPHRILNTYCKTEIFFLRFIARILIDSTCYSSGSSSFFSVKLIRFMLILSAFKSKIMNEEPTNFLFSNLFALSFSFFFLFFQGPFYYYSKWFGWPTWLHSLS